jgi:hypothetical protein
MKQLFYLLYLFSLLPEKKLLFPEPFIPTNQTISSGIVKIKHISYFFFTNHIAFRTEWLNRSLVFIRLESLNNNL